MASTEENPPIEMNNLNTNGDPAEPATAVESGSESVPDGVTAVTENGDVSPANGSQDYPHLSASFHNGADALSEKLDNISLHSKSESVNSVECSGNPESVSVHSGDASASSENASLSRSSSTTSNQKEAVDENGDSRHVAKAKVSPKAVNGTSVKTPSPGSQKSRIKNPFSFFKKKSQKDKGSERKDLDKMLAAVHIDSLPQLFVTKYLGFRETRGLYGVKYTREPLKEILATMSNVEKTVDLPLMQLHISSRGIHVTEHKQNMVKSVPIDSGLIPIDFISYGVQDIHLTRIFTFIVVREMSSKTRKLECHAYLCDSSVTCRKLALSVAMSFQLYAKTLQGKPHKFQVDLRPRAEIGHDLASSREETNDVMNCGDFEA